MSGPKGECCNDCKWIVRAWRPSFKIKFGVPFTFDYYACKRMPTAPEMALNDWCGGFDARPKGEEIYDETKRTKNAESLPTQQTPEEKD